MSDFERPHELIASDEYWAGTRNKMPGVPIPSGVIDGFTGVHVFASYGAAKVMGLYRLARDGGHAKEKLEPGQELPLLERGAGLIRVVEDIRCYPAGSSPLSRLFSSMDPETFDNLAERMLATSFYSGESAKMQLESDDERKMKIWRMVSYLTGSKSGAQLEGITSSDLRSQPSSIPMTYQMPPLVVGEIYSRGKRREYLSRVIGAEVLIPGSTRRARSPQKSKLSYRPKTAFNF